MKGAPRCILLLAIVVHIPGAPVSHHLLPMGLLRLAEAGARLRGLESQEELSSPRSSSIFLAKTTFRRLLNIWKDRRSHRSRDPELHPVNRRHRSSIWSASASTPTDTLLLVPRFPAYAGKRRGLTRKFVVRGGQVASAMVTGAKLGLRVKYIGTVGDDERGRIQLASLQEAHINLDDVEVRAGCPNQTAYIVIAINQHRRAHRFLEPAGLPASRSRIVSRSRKSPAGWMLHIDWARHAGRWRKPLAKLARAHGIPVSVDIDTIYHGFDRRAWLYRLSSRQLRTSPANGPANGRSVSRPTERIQDEYKMRVAAMTLGDHGALARFEGRFIYSPAFVVDCVDTTGAGDVFHGAFCYAVLGGMTMRDTLEFANAMAALNCTQLGARGGIANAAEARALMERAERRSSTDFAAAAPSA